MHRTSKRKTERKKGGGNGTLFKLMFKSLYVFFARSLSRANKLYSNNCCYSCRVHVLRHSFIEQIDGLGCIIKWIHTVGETNARMRGEGGGRSRVKRKGV